MKNITHFSILSAIFFINIYISQLIFKGTNIFSLESMAVLIINILIGHYYIKLFVNKYYKN